MSDYSERVVLVDDEASFLESAKLTLMAAGFTEVSIIDKSTAVMEYLRNNPVDILTLDLTMPNKSGESILEEVVKEFPQISVVVISGIMEPETIISCMKKGAKDYLIKPIDDERLVTTIKNVAKEVQVRRENQLLKTKCLKGELDNPDKFLSLVTGSERMKLLFSYAETVATSSLPVLITGETGTGKELMAEAIHRVRGEDRPFITCNVAGIDDAVFSDTLFGHVKGAFTGAQGVRSGLIEKAKGGTLFLDEIGDLSPQSQVKLLRLIQSGEYFPLGADDPHYSDVWIVAATHKDLSASDSFRKDLYYRIASHHIQIPPLRERTGDKEVLIRDFLQKSGKYVDPDEIEGHTVQILRSMEGKPLYGNVRELEGLVTDYILAGPIRDFQSDEAFDTSADFLKDVVQLPTMQHMKRELVQRAIEHCEGNKTKAAKLIDISKQTLFNLLK